MLRSLRLCRELLKEWNDDEDSLVVCSNIEDPIVSTFSGIGICVGVFLSKVQFVPERNVSVGRVSRD